MKKIFILLLAATMVAASFAGCGNMDNNRPNANTTLGGNNRPMGTTPTTLPTEPTLPTEASTQMTTGNLMSDVTSVMDGVESRIGNMTSR